MTDWLEPGVEPDIETLLRDEEMAALLARDGLDPDAVRAHAETARRALQQRARLAEAA